MRKLLLAGLLPTSALAQAGPTWGGGLGVGNCLEAHAGVEHRGWLVLARGRYQWWGPASGPGSGWLDRRNTSSRQVEAALLGGYGLKAGRWLPYGAAGLAYLSGRHLGEYRYTLEDKTLLNNRQYFFAYRDYQALGLPLEVGVLSPLAFDAVRGGLAFQANLNPQQPLYCIVLTGWLGNFGKRL